MQMKLSEISNHADWRLRFGKRWPIVAAEAAQKSDGRDRLLRPRSERPDRDHVGRNGRGCLDNLTSPHVRPASSAGHGSGSDELAGGEPPACRRNQFEFWRIYIC
jgi:hypothetical protein